MKKIAIFDLDGTLLNTLDSIAKVGNIILEKFDLAPVPTEVYPQFIGGGAAVLLKKLYTYAGGDINRFDEFFSEGIEVYKQHGSKGITVYDGIHMMFEKLKEAGVECAVLSNKPHYITVDACKKYFGDIFLCVYGQRENVAVKPDPFMIDEILKQAKVSKDECIYCGDSIVDVKTGINANVTMLGAAWGFYGDSPFEKADGILYHPLDLLQYIN